MLSSSADQTISALREKNYELVAELLTLSHFDLVSKVDRLTSISTSSVTRRDLDRALAIFSALVMVALTYSLR